MLSHYRKRADECASRVSDARADSVRQEYQRLLESWNALIRAEEAIDVDALGLAGDEATGALIVRRSLQEPARLIAGNAGFDGAVVVERIRGESDAMGFNAATGKWEDLRRAGIIDPAKVTRSALQNAASIAALVLTTECAIAEKSEGDRGAGEYGHME